jgi:cardiolipin synthase
MEEEKVKFNLFRKIATIGQQILRFLLSRYFITFIILLAEVMLVEHLIFTISENFFATTAVVLVLYFVGIVHLVNRETNPEYKLIWAMVMLIPIAGVVLYFLFYERRLSPKEARLLLHSEEELFRFAEPTAELDEDAGYYGKIKALLGDDPMAVAYGGTTSKFFDSGEAYFESLIEDLRGAEKFIFLEYFIIGQGKLWSKIHGILREKAAAGVEVRLLYDDIGCMQTLPFHYEKRLLSEGIKAYRFGRVTPRLSAVHNNRDHRKIAVIDGKVGYTGGVNIADEYVNLERRFGHWKDGGIRLEGDAVRGLLRLFLNSYDFTVEKISDYSDFLTDAEPYAYSLDKADGKNTILSNGENAPLSDGGIYVPFGSGPAPIYQQKVGKNLFLNIINQAKHYVWITTPYLIVDYELTEALCKAARRGVSVKIITPGIADKKIIKIMTKSSYPYLKKSGVEIYEYLPGFIHEKTLISDDRYLVVGTVNMDYRSLMHHFEDGVFVVDSPVCNDAKAAFEKTIKKSDYRDSIEVRLNIIEWAIRNIIKIFAPLL